MVGCGLPAFQQTDPALRISSRGGDDPMKLVPGNMVGAGAGHERPARTQHLQSAQIELLVAAQGSGYGALGFGKGGRIEHHRIEGLARRTPIAQKVEGVGLDPFHRGLKAVAVDLQVLFRHLEGCAGGIDAGHLGTGPGQVEREAALVGADVQRFPAGIALGRGVVEALVEKRSRLLPRVGVVVKGQTVEVKDGGQLRNRLRRI